MSADVLFAAIQPAGRYTVAFRCVVCLNAYTRTPRDDVTLSPLSCSEANSHSQLLLFLQPVWQTKGWGMPCRMRGRGGRAPPSGWRSNQLHYSSTSILRTARLRVVKVVVLMDHRLSALSCPLSPSLSPHKLQQLQYCCTSTAVNTTTKTPPSTPGANHNYHPRFGSFVPPHSPHSLLQQ